jgi:stage III sporulation protein AE
MEEILGSPLIPEELADSVSIKDILMNMISGKELISWEEIAFILKTLFLGELHDILILSAELISICIITGLLSGISSSFGRSTVSDAAGKISSFMAAGISLSAFYEVYMMCADAVSAMTTLMGASLPVIFTLTIVTGGAGGGTVMNSVISGAVAGFSAVILKLLMPAVFVSCIMIIINSLGQRNYIKKMSQFLRSFALFGTGFMITVFTGISAVQGIMTKSADSLLLRTARYSIDKFVPIIGGFTADSLELVLTAIGSLRNGVGIAGVIILILLLAGPLIKTLTIVLVFKFTAIVLEPMGNERVSDCMNDMGSAAMILGVLLMLSTIMFIIFFAVIMKFSVTV